MAGFEVVVRPAVFPDIRPQAIRALPIEDAPDKGIAVISGIGNALIDLPFSQQQSWSKSKLVERSRRFDKVRVYSSSEGSTRSTRSVDRSSYVEFEVVTAINYVDYGQETVSTQYASPQSSEDVEIISRGHTR